VLYIFQSCNIIGQSHIAAESSAFLPADLGVLTSNFQPYLQALLTLPPYFSPNAYSTPYKISSPEATLFSNFQIPLQAQAKIPTPALPRHVFPQLPKATHRAPSQNMGLCMSCTAHGRVIVELQSSMRCIKNSTAGLAISLSRVTPEFHQGI
jgi:hypothetical protein